MVGTQERGVAHWDTLASTTSRCNSKNLWHSNNLISVFNKLRHDSGEGGNQQRSVAHCDTLASTTPRSDSNNLWHSNNLTDQTT